jgi:hypothetical protein
VLSVETASLLNGQVQHFGANILNPADSKRAKMLPITFFATAFGLMMEKVRSIAMLTL